jgi:hypothetical protein
MLVSALDGRGIRIRRRWFPWRVKKRNVSDGALDVMDFTDGLEGLLFGLVFAVVIALFGSIILFGFEILLVAVLLVPLIALLRAFWVLPWVIETTNGDTLLGIEKVRGWRDSEERIREIAAAYQRGEDPFGHGNDGGLDRTGTK